MGNALVGHTGFVGGNLLRQAAFDDLYNSKNIEAIAGKSYDLLVCAGAPAEKWKANRDPAADWAAISRLAVALARARAERVVLISSVDVYPSPTDVDEDTLINPAETAYGRHRFLLEKFVQDHFDALVVRLPGLFGPGLKKNIIYDLLHDNNLGAVHADSVFQFYALDNLWRDVETARRAGLRLVNFATAPVSVAEVAKAGLGIDFTNRPAAPPVRYDFRSCHAALYGGAEGYLYGKAAVLAALRDFVAAERAWTA
jgi:nucleoside-diphosphate-sugar epimerase